MGTPQLHEDLRRDDEDVVVGPSDRSVGLVFAAVFAIIGCWPLWSGGGVRLWALVIAGGLAVVAFAIPRALAPLNRVWMRFGLLLHKVVNPLIMGLIYFAGVVPFGLGARLAGKDLLKLKIEREAKSYWIERRPPGPAPDSMRNQF